MKKVIGLILVTLMILVTLPAFADVIRVNITSVKMGDEYSVGSVVPLTIETNESMISRIDYYANGMKIPGTSTEADKPVLWIPEAPGNYILTAKVCSEADTVIGSYSPAVSVTVLDPAIKYLVKADKTSDLSRFRVFLSDEAAANTATDYKKIGNVSAAIGPMNNGSNHYAFIRNLNVDLGSVENRKYSYVNYSVYATKPFTIYSALKDSAGIARPTSQNGGWLSFKEGWNTLSVAIDENELGAYGASELTDITEIAFYPGYDWDIPDGFINQGYKIANQPEAADAYLYFDAVWLSKEAATKPQVIKTSIPDGQQNVCNGLGKYSIVFDQEMLASTLVKENIMVKDSKGKEVTVAGVRTSGKTMEVFFLNNSFAYNGIYTVSLNKNIESAKGISIGDDISFDFKIVNSCVNAQPVPAMTYPKNGALVSRNNALVAAKVIFDGKVNQVAFYEETGETDILLSGTPKEGSDNEYYLNVSDFDLGEHTIYAKVTYNNSTDTVQSEAVTFNVAEAEDYAIVGIDDNENIVANPNGQLIQNRTVGLNTTEKVAKVTYYLDGVEKAVVTTEPFTWDMPVAAVNRHILTATVVDDLGSVHNLTEVPYSVSFLTAEAVWTDDYDNSSTGLEYVGKIERSNITYVDDPAATNKREGMVACIDYHGGTDNNVSTYVKSLTIPDSRKVRIDLDMYVIYSTNTNQKDIQMTIRPSQQFGRNIQSFYVSSDQKYFKFNEWNNISVLIDFSQSDKTAFKTYVNGVEIYDDTVTDNTGFGSNFVIHLIAKSDYYIDNLKVYNYSDAILDAPAIGNVSFATDEYGWNASYNVVNFASEPTECIIYTAVYDDDNCLVSIREDIVSLAAGEIVNKSHWVSKTNGDQTGTRIRGFVFESVSGVTTCRPLADLQ